MVRSSCAAPFCSRSCSTGRHMLIGVIEMKRCQCPCGSITVLCTGVGIATCGAWLTRLFSSVSCASIVFFIASCNVMNVVIGSVILSQSLFAIVLKSSSCNTDSYIGLVAFVFFLYGLPNSVVPCLFSPTFAFPFSSSFACSFPFSYSFSAFFSLSSVGFSYLCHRPYL